MHICIHQNRIMLETFMITYIFICKAFSFIMCSYLQYIRQKLVNITAFVHPWIYVTTHTHIWWTSTWPGVGKCQNKTLSPHLNSRFWGTFWPPSCQHAKGVEEKLIQKEQKKYRPCILTESKWSAMGEWDFLGFNCSCTVGPMR